MNYIRLDLFKLNIFTTNPSRNNTIKQAANKDLLKLAAQPSEDTVNISFKGGTNSIKYLTPHDVMKIHTSLLRKLGGGPGIRDYAVLEAATARPQMGYYSNIAEMAASLMESLSQGHPFVDCNKKTAIVATTNFLKKNNVATKIKEIDAFEELKKLYLNNEVDFQHILTMIEQKFIKNETTQII